MTALMPTLSSLLDKTAQVMPQNGTDHVFLRNAYMGLGREMFPTTWMADPAPTSGLATIGGMPTPSLAQLYKAEPSENNLELYSMFARMSALENAQAAQRWLAKRAVVMGAEAGILRTFVRPVNGGAFIPVKPVHWNGEAVYQRFDSFKMNPEKPFTEAR